MKDTMEELDKFAMGRHDKKIRAEVVEEIEEWIESQKTVGRPSILTTVLGHWCIEISDLQEFLKTL